MTSSVQNSLLRIFEFIFEAVVGNKYFTKVHLGNIMIYMVILGIIGVFG